MCVPSGYKHFVDAFANRNLNVHCSAAYTGIHPTAAVLLPSSPRFMRAASGPEAAMLEGFSVCLQQTLLLCGDGIPAWCLGKADASQDASSPFLLPSLFQPLQDMSWLLAFGAAAMPHFWEQRYPERTSPSQPSADNANLSSVSPSGWETCAEGEAR